MSESTETLEISLRAGSPEVTLAGSLTHPIDSAAKGSVLLVSGSGPQDRDETIAGKKPFLQVREALADHGYIAVSFDDRGVGQSGGDYLAANVNVLINDIRSMMREISQRYPTLPMILAGHSQGALIASMVAAQAPDEVEGLALLAGSGMPGRQMFNEQHRRICSNEGWDKDSTDAMLNMKNACFDRMIDYRDPLSESETKQLHAALSATVQRFYREWGYEPDAVANDIHAMVDDLMEWEWRFLLKSQPADVLKHVHCPVFAAAGALDTQINPEADLLAIESALQAGQCTTALVPQLNHLFQRCQTGALEEYPGAGLPFHWSIIHPLVDWLNRVIDQRQQNETIS